MATSSAEGRPTPRGADLFAALYRQFDVHHTREGGGGIELTYVTGEQVISRLNEVLGIYGWQFDCKPEDVRLIEYHGEPYEFVASGRLGIYDAEAERYDAAGKMVASGQWVWRSQCGSQQVKYIGKDEYRKPMDLGFDAKGAVTDCLKKCAAAFGVALYLWDKEEAAQLEGVIIDSKGRQRVAPGGRGASAPAPAPAAALAVASPPSASSRLARPTAAPPPAQPAAPLANGAATPALRTDEQHCAYCGQQITDYTFKNGTDSITADKLIANGKRYFGAPLCMGDYSSMKRDEISKNRVDWPAQQVQANGQPVTAATHTPLEGLQAFIARSIETDFSDSKALEADEEELDVVTRLLWEAVGDNTDGLLDAIFGPSLNPLSKAEAKAIEKWTKVDSTWKNRAQVALAEHLARSKPAAIA